MASQAFDEEELSISLSPSQIRRNKRQGDVGYGQQPTGSITSMMAAGAENQAGHGPAQTNPPRDSKMRTEQRIGAYNIIKTLGEGSFGKVKLAVHRSTGQQVALKIISRKNLISRDMQGRVEREIEYLQLLRHPHIIKLYTVIKTPTEIIMVLEYAGGELFDYIVAHGKMKEDKARRFFQQMLCAVEYCHRHKIAHRDLKPENLLLDEHLNVKIADFGLSNIMSDGNFLKTSCGSPNYAAPEVIGGKLYAGPEVDVWSCGVILYVLLVGRLPFDDEHIPSLFAKIGRGSYMVPTWMDPGAAALIKKMLQVNPVQRATIEEIRQDPWFLKDLPAYLHPPVEEFMNTGVDPNKAIKVSDIAPNAPPQEQQKLHNEVTEKISKTMGYGKRDVLEALEAEEPSAIKDAYMIVRENKLMESNRKSSPFVLLLPFCCFSRVPIRVRFVLCHWRDAHPALTLIAKTKQYWEPTTHTEVQRPQKAILMLKMLKRLESIQKTPMRARCWIPRTPISLRLDQSLLPALQLRQDPMSAKLACFPAACLPITKCLWSGKRQKRMALSTLRTCPTFPPSRY